MALKVLLIGAVVRKFQCLGQLSDYQEESTARLVRAIELIEVHLAGVGEFLIITDLRRD